MKPQSKPRLAIAVMTGILLPVSAAAAGEDPCAAILRRDIFNESRSSKTVVIENTAKRYVCSHRGQDLADGKALELGFMIRFLGFRIGLAKDKVNAWIDSNCSDHSTIEKRTTHETTYTRNAEKALADAWLRCKTLEFKSSGIGITEEVPAVDRSGRAYRFRIAVLGLEYYWDKSSTTLVMHRRRPFDLQAQLRSREWLDTLASAKDLFAVGTASCGGTKDIEIERALARANRLRDWINAAHATAGRPPIRGTINLGKYTDEFCVEGSAVSDMQRPVIVLLVTGRPEGALRALDYHAALIDAASTHPVFQFDRYSNFDIALR